MVTAVGLQMALLLLFLIFWNFGGGPYTFTNRKRKSIMFLVSENKTRPCGGAGQVWHSTVQRQLPPRPSAGFYLTPPGPLEVSALPSAPPTPRAPSTEQILLNACPEQGPAAVGATHINKTTAPPPGSHIPSSKVALLPYTHTHTHTHTLLLLSEQ